MHKFYWSHSVNVLIPQHWGTCLGMRCHFKWQEECDHYFQRGSGDMCWGKEGIHSLPHIHQVPVCDQAELTSNMICFSFVQWCLAEKSKCLSTLDLKGGKVKLQTVSNHLVWIFTETLSYLRMDYLKSVSHFNKGTIPIKCTCSSPECHNETLKLDQGLFCCT